MQRSHLLSRCQHVATVGISILIRTLNSARTLQLVLERLHLEKDDELIIVDSGSSDKTILIAESFGAKVVHYNRLFNYSATLNIGFELSHNEWVLVLSSHTIPANDLFMTIAREFTAVVSADIAVGYGSSVVSAPAATSVDCGPAYERLPAGELSCGAGNTLALYRKSAWKERQFNTDIKTAEDLEWLIWAVRRGYTAARITSLVGVYRNQGSLAHMFRKGWKEVRQAQQLNPSSSHPRRNALDLFVGLGHYARLYGRGQLPWASMLRQQSHHLGACLAHIIAR